MNDKRSNALGPDCAAGAGKHDVVESSPQSLNAPPPGTLRDYKKAVGIVGDALRGSAIGLVPLDQNSQEMLADYIRLILQGRTHEEARSLIISCRRR